MKQTYILIISLLATVCLLSCGHPSVPENAKQASVMPAIYPDYTEVTAPSNICPMNFMLTSDCDEVIVRLTAGDLSYTYGGEKKIIIDEDEWNELRDNAIDKSINVEVFSRKGEAWTAYKPFNIFIAKEAIDPYISYRLIQPSFVAYEDLKIMQRNLTSFEETTIYDNRLVQTEQQGQCINCHSYQNYGTKNMLFHMRQSFGGTMITHDGIIEKVDLKTDSTLSAGVYPAWHPTEALIAFSTDNTRQSFHTTDIAKIEVFDTASDLILYDVNNHTVSTISNAPTEFEVFPTWSPDGNTLYYCSAHFEFKNDSISPEIEVIQRHKEIKYNIYSRTFDKASHSFGPEKLIFDAAALGKSATLPRISPDGRYMVFSFGNHGCFHVWHNEAEIMLLDLSATQAEQPLNAQPLTGINSKYSESYPSFSSNGRWVMSASRCDDGNYTRPVISYFDSKGKSHKAFIVPQQDPEFYTLFTRSFNRPEFMKEEVSFSAQQFAAKAKTDPLKVTYK